MDDGKIHKDDTVPPPPGESDAYNAATRVASINTEDWEALMAAYEGREQSSSSQHARAARAPVSERPADAPPEPPRADAIPRPAPLPSFPLPRLDEDDGGASVSPSAAEQVMPAPLVSAAPPARPSAFPEWVAGTNVEERAAHEETHRQRQRARLVIGGVVAVVVAVSGLVAAVILH